MQFDSQAHKDLCLQLIQAGTYPGQILELVLEFKQAVLNATVKEEKDVLKEVVKM